MRKKIGEHADKSEAVYQKTGGISISLDYGKGAICLKTVRITPALRYSLVIIPGYGRPGGNNARSACQFNQGD